jgi:membrane protease YdiL (CAAX protease family)
MKSSTINTKPLVILWGLLFSIGLYLLISVLRNWLFTGTGLTDGFSTGAFFISRMTLWLYLLMVYVYVVKVEKQKFLLWSEKNSSPVFYLVSSLLILLCVILVIGLLSKIETHYGWNKSETLKALLQLLWKNRPLMIFTTLSAGIIEELIFRGYLMPRLQVLVRNPWLTIFISSLLFGIAHYGYGSWSQIINPFFIGLIFSFHYQRYRNIKVLMLCHFLIDFISILTTH